MGIVFELGALDRRADRRTDGCTAALLIALHFGGIGALNGPQWVGVLLVDIASRHLELEKVPVHPSGSILSLPKCKGLVYQSLSYMDAYSNGPFHNLRDHWRVDLVTCVTVRFRK